MSGMDAPMRGRPLAMLTVVGVGWVAVRALTWEAPFPVPIEESVPIIEHFVEAPAPASTPGSALARLEATIETALADVEGTPDYVVRVPLQVASTSSAFPHVDQASSPTARAPQLAQLRSSGAGHQMLWLAAMSHLPVPAAIEQQVVTGIGPNAPEPGSPVSPMPSQQPRKEKPWSVDAWVLWRQGSGISQGRLPSYGASQAGAVLNYRLKPTSKHDPRVFMRGYRALIDNPETEVSLGFSGKPLPDLPLRLHAEMRATKRQDETDFRPSAFVTTELPPQDLPFDAYAEIYGQAGYVGGDFPTHFADGQLHIMRYVGEIDVARLSLGTAIWGGTQKGASRLDVGPSMRVDLDIGEVPARVSLDYREQVAGNAEPDSGVAVTVSTRF